MLSVSLAGINLIVQHIGPLLTRWDLLALLIGSIEGRLPNYHSLHLTHHIKTRYGVHFGSSTAQVNLANPNSDTLGVYAGTEDGILTLVIVNKDPSDPVALALSNVPTGKYFVRHFGGAAGVAKYQVSFCQVFLIDMALISLGFNSTDNYVAEFQRLHRCITVYCYFPETAVI